MDASKRHDERLQQLCLDTLFGWATRSPRVLPFLASRLHSSFPSLQLSALGVWLRLTSACEEGDVLEAALTAVPLFVSLAASKRSDVADSAMAVLVNLAAHKEAREQMWRTKGFVHGVRLQLTGQTAPVAVVRLLRCLSLSPELAEPMWKEDVVDDALHLMHSSQQRIDAPQQQLEEKAQMTRDVAEQQHSNLDTVDFQLQSGLYRYLRNLVSAKVETDGTDEDVSNERWEGRQWTILQSSVPDSVIAVHRHISHHIAASSFFVRLFIPAPPVPLAIDAARLLAALVVALTGGQQASSVNDNTPRSAVQATTRASFVSDLLECLAGSDRLEDQHAAVSAYRCMVNSQQVSQSESAAWQMRRSLLSLLQRSGSVHVVSAVVEVLTSLRQRDTEWQWDSSERQLLAAAFERWLTRVQRQQAGEDLDDPSDNYIMLCKVREILQQLTEDDGAASKESPSTDTLVKTSIRET